MAKIIDNLVVRGAAGSLGRQVVLKRDRAGRTIISCMPQFAPDRVFTPAQLARQALFRQAAAYAVGACHHPAYAALAAGTSRTAYNLAISDWHHPPEILGVDLQGWHGQPGEPIRIRALDDVLVTRVTVCITADDGTPLEEGPAVQADGFWWQYTTVSSAPAEAQVRACAWDLPGHTGTLTVGRGQLAVDADS